MHRGYLIRRGSALIGKGREKLDLETVLRKLVETPEFFQLGDADAGTLTWPKAPSQEALKWPIVVVFCSAGHEIGLINLTFDVADDRWVMQSDPAVQASPGWEGARYPGNLMSLERSVIRCEECQRKRSTKQQSLPLTGKRLLSLYAEAVMKRKASLRLR